MEIVCSFSQVSLFILFSPTGGSWWWEWLGLWLYFLSCLCHLQITTEAIINQKLRIGFGSSYMTFITFFNLLYSSALRIKSVLPGFIVYKVLCILISTCLLLVTHVELLLGSCGATDFCLYLCLWLLSTLYPVEYLLKCFNFTLLTAASPGFRVQLRCDLCWPACQHRRRELLLSG